LTLGKVGKHLNQRELIYVATEVQKISSSIPVTYFNFGVC